MRSFKFKGLKVKSVLSLFIFFFFALAQSTLGAPSLPSEESPFCLYATPLRDDLRRLYLSAIESANTSIDFTVYALKDFSIIAALNKKGAEGIPTTVRVDRNASAGVAKQLGKGVKTTYSETKGLMHKKILVIDGQRVLIGSANMTSDSLRHHGNLVVGLNAPGFATHLLKGTGSSYTWKQEEQTIAYWNLPSTPPDLALNELRGLLASAQKTIKVAMFTFTNMALSDDLIAAKKRGVAVEVALDRNAAYGCGKNLLKQLAAAKIPIAISSAGTLLHHKFCLVDDHTLAQGSANWTKAAFTVNDDCFMIISDLSKEQTATLHKVWKAIVNDSIDRVNM